MSLSFYRPNPSTLVYARSATKCLTHDTTVTLHHQPASLVPHPRPSHPPSHSVPVHALGPKEHKLSALATSNGYLWQDDVFFDKDTLTVCTPHDPTMCTCRQCSPVRKSTSTTPPRDVTGHRRVVHRRSAPTTC